MTTTQARTAGLRLRVAGVLSAAFAVLTVVVAAGHGPVLLDATVERHLPGPGAGGVAGLLRGLADHLTGLATPAAWAVATVVVAALLARAGRTLAPLRQVVAPLGALVVTVVVGKTLLHRPGPPGMHLQAVLGYYPSGHTTTALVCTGTLAALLARRWPGWRTRLYVGAAVWTLLVGWALVYHRFHWVTDVLGGLLLGAVILLLTTRDAR